MNILLVIYKIEENKGSEDGTGYHLALALMRKYQNITIISRQNNIEKLKRNPLFSNAELIGIDVPFAFFKKKSRGIILYYYLWQLLVGLKIRQLQKHQPYDVIHQINFHASWAPHFVFSKKAKIIWGPLTQHPKVPYALWDQGLYFSEWLKSFVKKCFWHFDPFLKRAIKRSHTVFFGHSEIPIPFTRSADKIVLLPQGGSVFPTLSEKNPGSVFSLLFVGRFISLKGTLLAAEAAKHFLDRFPAEKIQATFIGEGPLHHRLQMLDPRFNILPWQDQHSLSSHYKQASIFLFPSLEGQGLVVAEALAHGCPVLCLEHTGPATLADRAGITIKIEKRAEIIDNLTRNLETLATEYWHQPERYQKRIDMALARSKELSWQAKANLIAEYYDA